MKFVKTDYRTLELNPMTLIGDEWMLVTAGDDQTGWNTMTASWGHLGYIWQRPTAICYIRPQRYTRQLSYLGSHSGRDEDKVKTVGLTPVFGDGYTYFEEAKLVLVCRKLYQAPLLEQGFVDPAVVESCYPKKDFHDLYVGEIVEVLTKA